VTNDLTEASHVLPRFPTRPVTSNPQLAR
jgi:hypothetical protein